jgi:hypothetical protein
MSDFYQSEQGCMWPHQINGPIHVYDRASYKKYLSGEYQPPDHCICGAEITYETPITVVLVQRGQMTGEMILTLEIPLTLVRVDLSTEGDAP